MNLNELIQKYINKGYKRIDATSRVSQDIILLKISKSNFKKHITIKGGVVMHNISKDKRRATRDMDIDFIKYSLEDKSILRLLVILQNYTIKIMMVNELT